MRIEMTGARGPLAAVAFVAVALVGPHVHAQQPGQPPAAPTPAPAEQPGPAQAAPPATPPPATTTEPATAQSPPPEPETTTQAVSPAVDEAIEPNEELDPSSSRPGVGIVGAAGLHTGLAAGLRLGLGDVGLEVAGGYQLLLAVWRQSVNDTNIDAASSAQVGAELYVTPWHPRPTTAIGMKSGYRYNSVLQHGFSVAITFLVDLNPHLALEVLAGGSFFPDSTGRLRDALDLPSGADIIYGSSYQFFEYGFELVWYP
jgi:hypothetical protein